MNSQPLRGRTIRRTLLVPVFCAMLVQAVLYLFVFLEGSVLTQTDARTHPQPEILSGKRDDS